MHTISQAEYLFDKAATLHEQGQILQARELYLHALNMEPELIEANFNLALIEYQQGNLHNAISNYKQVLKKNPAWIDAWYNLAQSYETLGDISQAVDAYQRILQYTPENSKTLYNLGCIYLQQEKYETAANYFRKVINKRADNAHAYNNLGSALQALGQQEQAEAMFQQAAKLAPDFALAWFNIAEIQVAQGLIQEAIPYYRKSIRCNSEMEAAYNNMGNAYRKLKRYDEAASCFRYVVQHNPHLAQGHYNLGSTFRDMEQYEEAITHLLNAIKLKSDYAEAWNNLALTFKNMGDMDRALTCFNRAIDLDPELAVARWNRSFVYLLKEDYLSAWPDFEWRFRMPQKSSIYPLDLKGLRWNGQTDATATILVHDEQGFGDTLQMIRYLPLVKARCGKVILETRQELISLLKYAKGIDQLITRSTRPAPDTIFDYYIPMMSLPGLFQTTADTIPATLPFFSPDPGRIESWNKKLPKSGLRIGLVWSGRPQHTNDKKRSCRLENFLPLLNTQDFSVVGLQKGPGAEQIKDLPTGIKMSNIGSELQDFSDTASVLSCIDLLITVDTAVAHLAGALGKPVWVMVPYIPDWRWGLKGDQTPWYKSMRLFRQPQPNDWPSVINQMVGEIELISKNIKEEVKIKSTH